MIQFILTIQASVAVASGAAPMLNILVDGTPVTSSSGITAVTGVGSDILSFTIDYNGNFPTSLAFRFDGGSGDPSDVVTIESVRINGQQLGGGDLTATVLAQGQTSSVSNTNNLDHIFGRVEPTAGDLGTVTHNGTGGDDADLRGSSGSDVINGSAGNDRIRGLGSDDAINGGTGNDVIFGEGGNDIIIAGTGVDRVFGGDGDDLIHGQGDNDILLGEAGNDVINGGLGNDVLVADAGDDILFGEDGADRLIGVSGNNTMYGDAGNDVLLGGVDNDVMYGGDGNNTVFAQDDDKIHGGDGNDTIFGENGDDFITGGNGIDTIDGGDDSDYIWGGADNDILSGGDGNDQIYGDDGDDIINGDDGNDTLNGGDGADTLNGGAGNDVLQGSALDVWEVSAILAANPNVVFSEETNSFYQLVSTNVTFAGAQGVSGATTLNGVNGHLVTISTEIENTFIDTLAAGNQIWINASDGAVEGEWRWAGGEEDGLLLWNGDQTGSAINGFYYNWDAGQPGGGAGQDAAVMQADGTWNDVNASGTNYYIIEWDGSDFSDDNASDTLNGDNGNDLLLGNGGDDILSGGGGTDHIFGGAGDDIMNGNNNGDFLYDDQGANEFYGGNGDDTLDARFQTAIPSIADQIATYLAENPSLNYSSATGNFYQAVTNTLDWFEARTAAAGNTLNGVAGHLGTITSTAEHNFIVSLALGANTWLGGSDNGAVTGGVEGDWYWVEGPEAGTHFSTGGTAEPGQFTNWNPGQPNDSDGFQDYLYLLNTNNGWADLGFEGDGTPVNGVNYVTVPKYLVEWEGADVLVAPPTEAAQSGQYMEGGNGDDTIYGGNGDDEIYGQDDNDLVYGGDGDDTIDGGNNNDTLYGGLGSDNITGGSGNDTIYAAFASGASAIPVSADFEGGTDSFTYADGTFGSSGSSNSYASGTRITTDAYTGSASLEITLGGINGNTITNMSGSWDLNFTLTSALSDATISLAYRVLDAVVDTDPMDNNEDLRLYADIDGTQYGTSGNDYFFEKLGSDGETAYDSGWQTVQINVGALTVGAHTLSLGGLFTSKSWTSEQYDIRFDDVVLQNSSAATSDSSATNIIDGGDDTDTIYGSDGTDTLLGGAGNDTLYSGSVAGYTVADALAENANVNYNATTGNFYEVVTAGTNYATASANAAGSTLNGVGGHLATITSAAENTFIDNLLSNPAWIGGSDSGTEDDWLWVEGPDSGTHFSTGSTAEPGQYANWAGGQPNDFGGSGQDHMQIQTNGTWADFNGGDSDDYVIEWEGSDILGGGNVTTMNGGAGADSLYGSDGEELFVFEDFGAATFTDADTIYDFDETDGDTIDISDILDGYGVTSMNLLLYVDISAGSGVRIDLAGTGIFGATVATFAGSTTVSDEATLLASGQLII